MDSHFLNRFLFRTIQTRLLTRAGKILILGLFLSIPAHAEYGDIVLNNTAKNQSMRSVIFPHWVHRMRFSCRNCHDQLGFKFKVGTSGITMQKIFQGQFCAVCHNGKIAWGIDKCELCHTGFKELDTQVHKSTKQTLVAPLE